ncbi:MAG: trypsin-like peptidase domain-containing protein [Idiomarina sp.]|nr:trypsin-like peptidase domain-containing protein [Idiomarina sp.]
MSKARHNFTQLILKPALMGLLVALVVLVVLPLIDNNRGFQLPQQAAVSSYADAVNKASPAVVNIYTTQSVRQSPYDPTPRTMSRLGSGVIMDGRGFIITANHVVTGNDEIRVALQDGRLMAAQLVGSDRLTDLAVLRIEADNLPVIPRNDELQPRVGDVVLAIGNPYNLGQTVTQGIISATGRVGLAERTGGLSSGYSDFLQMDAAINEGNSGGALVNSNGDLVGINNASYQSQIANRATTGIYFAVPYHLARRIMQQIISDGVVVRGYIGITAEQHYSDMQEMRGLLVSALDPSGPAANAGLRVGDFIYEIGGEPIQSVNQGLDIVAETRPGEMLEVLFYRDVRPMRAEVRIDRLRE